ncbi:hypothetical protein AAKU67_004071, partial [Oxalobacteraceae bacterium GrIS 2.11]
CLQNRSEIMRHLPLLVNTFLTLFPFCCGIAFCIAKKNRLAAGF